MSDCHLLPTHPHILVAPIFLTSLRQWVQNPALTSRERIKNEADGSGVDEHKTDSSDPDNGSQDNEHNDGNGDKLMTMIL